MKTLKLEQKLKQVVTEVIGNMKSTNENNEEVAIKVIRGPIPPERYEEIIPAISIRTTAGFNKIESQELDLKFVVGLFGRETEETYNELHSLIELLTKTVAEHPIVEGEYEVQPAFRWEVADNQPYPYMIGVIHFKAIMKQFYRTDLDDYLGGTNEESNS